MTSFASSGCSSCSSCRAGHRRLSPIISTAVIVPFQISTHKLENQKLTAHIQTGATVSVARGDFLSVLRIWALLWYHYRNQKNVPFLGRTGLKYWGSFVWRRQKVLNDYTYFNFTIFIVMRKEAIFCFSDLFTVHFEATGGVHSDSTQAHVPKPC